MESSVKSFLLFLSLFLPASGNIVDDLLPSFTERFSEILQAILPIPDSVFDEVIDIVGSYYIPVNGDSDTCRNHSAYMLKSLVQSELWAARMVDAASKLPSGVLDGHMMDLGSFDQCLGVVEPQQLFTGKYCIVETKGLLPDTVNIVNPNRTIYPSIRIDAWFAVCVPSTCSSEDVMAHMNAVLNPLNGSATVIDDNCTIKTPEPFSTGDFIVMAIIFLLVSLVSISTIYDSITYSEKNPYLVAFSLNANISKMISTETTPGMITCLNGLRVLAFSWVLLGHRLMILIFFPGIRLRHIFENLPHLSWAPLNNGMLAVDIFFFMTGLLVTYCYLQHRQKGKNVSLVHFYLIRYLRLTPALAFIVMITGTISIRFTDGPLWKRAYGLFHSYCQTTWWNTLLYIQNYTNPYKICVPQTWYLAADFQMYVLSPLILIPLFNKPRVGVKLMGLFLLLTTGAGLWNAYSLNLRAGGGLTVDRRTEYTIIKDYFVTHVRAATFIIGVAMGFLHFKVKEDNFILKLSRRHLLSGWLSCIVMILFSVLFIEHFQQEDYVYNQWQEVSYQVFHRHIFILGISWIVLVCDLGYGGFVNAFLSWKAFIPLSRLTYSAYLLHFLVQFVITFNSRAPGPSTTTFVWSNFFSDLMLCYMCAMVLYLLVECPCTNLINLAFQGNKKNAESTKLPTTSKPPVIIKSN